MEEKHHPLEHAGLDPIAAFLHAVRIEEPVSVANLTVYPLVADTDRQADYLRLDEALETEDFIAEEVSDGGTVGTIRIRNGLKRPVLIVDGDTLVGAKQNRIVNRTILVAAESTTDVPVSCVEHGRWGGGRRFRKQNADRLFASARAHTLREVNASVASGRGFRADQRALWGRIEERRARRRAETSTGAMNAIYERERPTLSRFASAIQPKPRQIGAVFAVDGEPCGLDLFDAASTCHAYLERLVRSYALDAIDSDHPRPDGAARGAVERLLADLREAHVERSPSVAVGEDARLRAKGAEGAALVLEDRIVHLSAFTAATAGGAG